MFPKGLDSWKKQVPLSFVPTKSDRSTAEWIGFLFTEMGKACGEASWEESQKSGHNKFEISIRHPGAVIM